MSHSGDKQEATGELKREERLLRIEAIKWEALRPRQKKSRASEEGRKDTRADAGSELKLQGFVSDSCGPLTQLGRLAPHELLNAAGAGLRHDAG